MQANVNAYKEQQILTAKPEQLTLMLYNGAIKFINETIRELEQKNIEQASKLSWRAQAIVRELVATLKPEYEVSDTFLILYDFVERNIIMGNAKMSVDYYLAAKTVLVDMRDNWMEAMKIAATEHKTINTNDKVEIYSTTLGE